MQKVVANIPKHHRDKAHELLGKLDTMQVVMGEIVTLELWTPTHIESHSSCVTESPLPLVVLFSRYRDNM